MFNIYLNDDLNTPVQNADMKVINPVLKQAVNTAGSLTYLIPYNDKYYEEYKERVSTISIYNDDVLEWKGFLLTGESDFYNTKTLEFAGEMAYLNDVQYPPYEFTGDIPEFMRNVLDYYNSKCSTERQILAGTITVSDPNNYINRSNEEYSSCWSVLKEKLVDLCGGYLVLRYTGGKRYLDYLIEPGTHNTQKIEFGKNLLDIERYIDASEIATVLIPQGAEIEEEENEGETQQKKRVDITSVNNGLNYVETSFVNTYGRIETVVQWNDVTLPENLLTKATEYAETMAAKNMTITTKVVDLHLIDSETMNFDVGDTVDCVSTPHNLDVTFMITERERNLNEPESDTITIGTESKTYTSMVDNTIKQVNDAAHKITSSYLQKIIEGQTKLLLEGKEGFIKLVYDENGDIKEIYAMDSAQESTAKNVIVINKNGIGFSHDGVEGPFVYGWTIDGTFNTDFIHTEYITVGDADERYAAKGDSIAEDTLYYLATDKSENVTIAEIGWSTDASTQILTAEKPYLWIYHMYTYSDGNTEKTTPVLSGRYGKDGEAGAQGEAGVDGTSVTISSTDVAYAISKSATITPVNSEFGSTMLATTLDKPYLWTRTVVNYSDGSSTCSYSVSSTIESVLEAMETTGFVEINGGNITQGSSKSKNYQYTSGDYADYGMMIDYDTGIIRSTGLFLDGEGTARFKGIVEAESIAAIEKYSITDADDGLVFARMAHRGGIGIPENNLSLIILGKAEDSKYYAKGISLIAPVNVFSEVSESETGCSYDNDNKVATIAEDGSVDLSGGLSTAKNITGNNMFLTGTVIRPQAENTSNVNIGSSTYSFYNLYLNHCVYYTNPPTGSGTPVYINSNGAIVKYSSARKLKNDIKDVKDSDLDPHKLYELPVRQYKYNDGVLEENDDLCGKTTIGFIADEVEDVYPAACAYDPDGEPTSWNANVLIPAMLKLIQEQHDEIMEIKKELNK